MKKNAMLLLLSMIICVLLASCSCKHENLYVQTIQSTCTESGKKTTVCKDCGLILNEETLPLLEHDFKEKDINENNCSINYECSHCKYITNETHTQHEDAGGGICKYCKADSRELTKKLCIEKGEYIAEKKVYRLKETANNYWVAFQYEKDTNTLFLIVYHNQNGLLAIRLSEKNEFRWFFFIQRDFYWSELNNNTVYISGTRNYDNVKYSTRLNKLSYDSKYGFTGTLLSTALVAANEMTFLACTGATLLFIKYDLHMSINFLGFKNWEN